MSDKRIFVLFSFFSLLMFIAVAGCGSSSKIGDVSGKVTLDGKPLAEEAKVVISFVHKVSGNGNGAFLEPDGSYKVEGLLMGEYNIGILADIPMMREPGAPPLPQTAIPQSYADVHSSGLTFTVVPGPNVFDINLQKKKK